MIQLNPIPCRVEHTEELREAFDALFRSIRRPYRPKAIIETGTADGLGTTSLLAEVVVNSPLGTRRELGSFTFISIEVDSERAKVARENLRKYRHFLEIRNGLSVDYEEALEFLAKDELLNNPDDYPGIYFDAENPLEFYRDEISKVPTGKYGKRLDNFLYKAIANNKRKVPLFVLDSAGGLGWMEYKVVTKLMYGFPYWVWLHDIKHVKHVRSYEHIKNCNYASIFAVKEGEWVLARFKPKTRRGGIQ